MSAASNLLVRKLEVDDFGKGFLALLAQLTTVGRVNQDEFTGRWWELNDNPDYYIAVAEDTSKSQLLGTAALIIERKFIHSCGKVGHIEDVVVDEAARGHNLGHRLIDELVRVARQQGCYKVILDCAEHNIPFYEKCGLSRKEVQMVKYLDR
ncbi:hypothetical protein OEZ85_014080 [Tetradesmus obliquus]|uniref:Glucosamine 6-phosphate N-acetyltransferase n=2 Tax=Tetradesmus obliquus TaxID=3088 RepID=A0A383VBD8_TETOB|nr:hypothetical protein OEZ85_014080 [Tetradesmus obliquus]|eukprot:jgi/Sobl393_1/14773/SZX62511.1